MLFLHPKFYFDYQSHHSKPLLQCIDQCLGVNHASSIFLHHFLLWKIDPPNFVNQSLVNFKMFHSISSTLFELASHYLSKFSSQSCLTSLLLGLLLDLMKKKKTMSKNIPNSTFPRSSTLILSWFHCFSFSLPPLKSLTSCSHIKAC